MIKDQLQISKLYMIPIVFKISFLTLYSIFPFFSCQNLQSIFQSASLRNQFLKRLSLTASLANSVESASQRFITFQIETFLSRDILPKLTKCFSFHKRSYTKETFFSQLFRICPPILTFKCLTHSP